MVLGAASAYARGAASKINERAKSASARTRPYLEQQQQQQQHVCKGTGSFPTSANLQCGNVKKSEAAPFAFPPSLLVSAREKKKNIIAGTTRVLLFYALRGNA